MKPIIIDMKEMSDSTEVYSQRPHPFFTIFIYMILGMAVIALVWAALWKMDVVVKSNGIFKTEDTIGNVSSSASGRITACNISEGIYVNEGDVLFQIGHEQADESLKTYQDLLEDVQDRLTVMKAYIEYLDGDSEALAAVSEKKYYSEFMNRNSLVDTSLHAADITASNEVAQCEQSVSGIKASIEHLQESKASYEQMLVCVKNGENTFAEEEMYYYTMAEGYLTSYDSTRKQYDDKITQYEKQRELAKDSEKAAYDETIADARIQKDNALNSLKLERIAAIEQQIETIKSSLLTANTNLNTANTQLSAAQNGTGSLSNNATVYTEKNAVNTEVLNYENKKLEYEKNIASVSESIEKCQMTAKTSGYISMLADLHTDSYIQEGTAVCQIMPEQSENYYADVYLSNQDIGKITEGQPVKFEIAAYPSSEYGYFTGVVDTIAKDVKVDNSSGSAYYLVKVKCDKTLLRNKKGDSVAIMNGMACQAKVITDEQSVLKYVLQKIDLMD